MSYGFPRCIAASVPVSLNSLRLAPGSWTIAGSRRRSRAHHAASVVLRSKSVDRLSRLTSFKPVGIRAVRFTRRRPVIVRASAEKNQNDSITGRSSATLSTTPLFGSISRAQCLAFASAWVAYAALYCGRNNFGIAKSTLTAAFGPYMDSVAMGAVDSVFLFSYACGSFLWATIVSRVGRLLILIALVGSSLANMALPFLVAAAQHATFPGVEPVLSVLQCATRLSPNLASIMVVPAQALTLLALAACWALNGVVQSAGWPGCSATIVAWFPPREHGRVMGAFCTCYQAGAMFAAWLSTCLLLSVGWQAAFYGAGALMLSVAAIYSVVAPHRPSMDARPRTHDHDRERLEGEVRANKEGGEPEGENEGRTSEGGRDGQGDAGTGQGIAIANAEIINDAASSSPLAQARGTLNELEESGWTARLHPNAARPLDSGATDLVPELTAVPVRSSDKVQAFPAWPPTGSSRSSSHTQEAPSAGIGTSNQRWNKRTSPASWLCRSRQLAALALAYALIKFIRYALMGWLPFYMVRVLGYPISLAGRTAPLFELAGMVGSMGVGWVADHLFLAQGAARGKAGVDGAGRAHGTSAGINGSRFDAADARSAVKHSDVADGTSFPNTLGRTTTPNGGTMSPDAASAGNTSGTCVDDSWANGVPRHSNYNGGAPRAGAVLAHAAIEGKAVVGDPVAGQRRLSVILLASLAATCAVYTWSSRVSYAANVTTLGALGMLLYALDVMVGAVLPMSLAGGRHGEAGAGPVNAAQATALVNGAGSVGSILSGVVVGVMVSVTGWAAVFLTFCPLALVAAALIWPWDRSQT